jgi:glycerophosphoryl diester phosphodiesterase
MLIIGHRGLMGEAPQNTMDSFRQAIEKGLPMIELDVRQTITGEVIVFHDMEVSKITRGANQGYIKLFPFKKIRGLDVHDGFAGGPYQVPTLEEVLDLVESYAKKGKKTCVNIELKGYNTAKPVSKIIKKYLKNGWKNSDFLICSWRYREIDKFKRRMPNIDTVMLINDFNWLRLMHSTKVIMEFAKILRVSAINPRTKLVNKKLINEAHKNGLKVNAYSVKTHEEYLCMKKLGVDGVIVDFSGLDKPS